MRCIARLVLFFVFIACQFSIADSHVKEFMIDEDGQQHDASRITSTSKKPNILLILADDVGTGDIPHYWGNNIVQMPNIEALQKKGVTFMDAHATPLCAPSRYMLLSGNYAHRGRYPQGAWGFKEKDGSNFDRKQKTMAQMLKNAGYRTTMYGKWHLGGEIPQPGTLNKTHILSGGGNDWSNPITNGPNDYGFDESYFTMAGIQTPPYSFFRDGYLTTSMEDVKWWKTGRSKPANKNGKSRVGKAGEGDKYWDSTEYNMRLVQETNDFLANHNTTDPFFIYFAMGAVHTPHSPAQTYLDGTKIAGTYNTSHLDLLHEMDLVVGSLTSMLEDQGLIEDTIIIFASDNGGLVEGSSSGKLRGKKSSIYEGGHRVPLIMRYDNILPAGETRDNLVGLNDLYATIADLAGTRVPDRSAQDSISFASHAISESNASPREWLGTWAFQMGKTSREAIRYGHMKLVRILRASANPTYEMYNLSEDIGEKKNLLKRKFRTNEINELKTMMRKYLRREGPCPADHKGSFKNAKNKWVTCDFFKAYPVACEWQVQGELFCNSICGRHRNFCPLYV
ncbi:hypothetical protein CTEN210_14007 [Chaetoceros tenuissimus]|uniref:Sulfatase N-terminal domain-containing protein n=1 Tax=Chaetoceros tenuissimus TaxID=426638 RepID=A0AAD3D6D7_9STRA|nr:hypothetical protein CTEN210_14007 [Chaetoceros tenuissimus]